MDPRAVEEYLELVPQIVRSAIKPLSNDKVWAVYIALLKNKNIRFNQIKEIFKADTSGEIDRILKSLATAGLITKKISPIDRDFKTSVFIYTPTELGESLIDILLVGILIPDSVKILNEWYESEKASKQPKLLNFGPETGILTKPGGAIRPPSSPNEMGSSSPITG